MCNILAEVLLRVKYFPEHFAFTENLIYIIAYKLDNLHFHTKQLSKSISLHFREKEEKLLKTRIMLKRKIITSRNGCNYSVSEL